MGKESESKVGQQMKGVAIYSLQVLADELWLTRMIPLINQRNQILDAHDNSFEVFELPEIKEIDKQLDELGMIHHKMLQNVSDMLLDLKLAQKNPKVLEEIYLYGISQDT